MLALLVPMNVMWARTGSCVAVMDFDRIGMITVVVVTLVDDVDVAIPTDDHSELFVRCSSFDTLLTAQIVGVHAGFLPAPKGRVRATVLFPEG